MILPAGSFTAVVAARDEDLTIAATVRALLDIGDVAEVLVVDDGSEDHTAHRAREAGARVIRTAPSRGKGGALELALDRLPGARAYLLADADLGSSARELERVIEPVRAGRADLAIAALPKPPAGGFGLVRRAAGRAVEWTSGCRVAQPLSGQRAVTAECLRACRPLAGGFGVEAAMTADAARLRFRVMEVPARVRHRYTRRDLSGFVHRARQGAHMLRAMAPRLIGLR